MRRYRAHRLTSNVTLGPLLPGNGISLSSPSPPNAFAFTVFRVHLNPSVRPLLPCASLSPPPPPPPLSEGDSSANATSVETLLLQAGHAIAHVRRFRVSTQAQPQVSSFTLT